MHRSRQLTGLAALAAASGILFGAAESAGADPVADFYAGKRITILNGYPSGSSYNVYSRVLAEHMTKHIPGKPTIIVQEMTGAGSLKAANYVYNVAPKDGTYIGAVGRGIPTEPLIFGDKSKAKFDPLKINWIGSISSEVSVAAIWHAAGIDSLEGARKKSLHIATGGMASDSAVFTILANSLLGTKFDLVCCYRGGGNQFLAMERGEADGRVGVSWSSIKQAKMDWYREGKIKIILQFALEKHPELPKVPLILDLVDAEDKMVVEAVMIRQAMGRPYMAPPGLPSERVEALRAAFATTVADPAFLAAAEKHQLEINRPRTGQEVEALLKRSYGMAKSVLAKVHKAIDPKVAGTNVRKK